MGMELHKMHDLVCYISNLGITKNKTVKKKQGVTQAYHISLYRYPISSGLMVSILASIVADRGVDLRSVQNYE